MSDSSTHPTSHEASETQSENGASSATDALADNGESSPSEESERGPAEAMSNPTQRHTAKRSQPAESSTTSTSFDVEYQPGRKRSLKGQAGSAYRSLLNRMIADANGKYQSDDLPLPPSQIGASYWTSSEKDAFFTKLAVCGPGNLRVLSQAVRSKSEAEVHVYVKLLQDGVEEVRATLPSQVLISPTDVHAAHDVSAGCETWLEASADSLAQTVEQNDIQCWKQKYGEYWLIDETLAEELQQQADLEDELDLAEDDHIGHPDAEEDTTMEGPGPTDHEKFAKRQPATPLSAIPAARLLRPAVCLQLVRDVFMNGPLDGDRNWRDIVSSHPDLDAPAIYRSAFEDFHTLTISLTRRLVQVSLFQAMSRLRASDGTRTNWQRVVEVTSVDVRVALDILGLKENWGDYWATLPRRCPVDVYGESKKYKDGRPGTKNGYKLTLDEVEAELGFGAATPGGPLIQDEQPPESDSGFDFDTDMYTLEGSDEELPSTREEVSKQENGATAQEEEMESEVEEKVKMESKKRKRNLSLRSVERAADAFLDHRHVAESAKEERRLWEMLKLKPPDGLADGDTTNQSPELQGSEAKDGWRSKTHYQAAWETGCLPQVHEFAAVKERGRRNRARKPALHAHVEETRAQMEVGDASVQSPRLSQDSEAGYSEYDEDAHSDDDNGRSSRA